MVNHGKTTTESIKQKAVKDGISAFFFDSGKSNAITIGVTEMEVD